MGRLLKVTCSRARGPRAVGFGGVRGAMVITVRDPRVAVPQLPPKYVSRGRLVADLDRAADLPLTLLCAGPGAGKTALLAEWAEQATARVAWVCPAAADAEPARFWRLIESALPGGGAALPGGESALPGGGAAPCGSPDGTAADGTAADTGPDRAQSLLRRILSEAVPLVVIIDDAHVLDHPDVLDGLDSLIQAPQPGLRLVLAARSDPLLPLHKYRLAPQLVQPPAADMAMTRAEAQEVLATHGVTLPKRDFDLLMTRTEGWATGVRLSAMRMEGTEDPGSFAAQLALDPGSIGEYL